MDGRAGDGHANDFPVIFRIQNGFPSWTLLSTALDVAVFMDTEYNAKLPKNLAKYQLQYCLDLSALL